MIIAFDATAIGSRLGGDETLVSGLLRGLLRESQPEDRVSVLAARGAALPSDVLLHPRAKVEYVARRPGAVHFSTVLPWWLAGQVRRRVRPDIVVTNTHAPVVSPAPVALMVPDLSFCHFPEGYPRATRVRLQQVVGHQVHRAAAVLTISDFCRDDIISTYALPPARVHTVPLTIDPPRPPMPGVRRAMAARGVAEDYVLYLGNLHPRKNVPRLISAFLQARQADPALAGHQLVVAGRPWFDGTAEREAAATAPDGAVVFLDRVTDDEREVLIRDARALAYVSLFEGFGLPPLEAMARGVPAVTSSVTAIPEVCGDAALLVDPRDEVSIARALRRVLTDEALRRRMVAAGHRQVARFTSERTGRALRGALTSALCEAPMGSLGSPAV